MSRRDPDAAFDAFYAAVRHADVLPPKTRLMLHLAAAFGAGCEP